MTNQESGAESTAATAPRPSISWELVGILAVLAVFLIMFLIWVTSPSEEAGEALQAPEETTLASPLGLEAGLTDEGRPYLGSPDSVTVVYEFADFNCASSAEFAREGAGQLQSDYLAEAKAQLVWVNLPQLGPASEDAARAAICASDEGRFWDLHDWFFANQGSDGLSPFSREGLEQIAGELGLDWPALDECMGSPETGERLQADRDLAAQHGIDATPSFLVGDEVVVGPDMEALGEVLDKYAEM